MTHNPQLRPRASGGIRTRNIRITNAVLCQLKLRWQNPCDQWPRAAKKPRRQHTNAGPSWLVEANSRRFPNENRGCLPGSDSWQPVALDLREKPRRDRAAGLQGRDVELLVVRGGYL